MFLDKSYYVKRHSNYEKYLYFNEDKIKVTPFEFDCNVYG